MESRGTKAGGGTVAQHVREIAVPLDQVRSAVLSNQIPVSRYYGAFIGWWLMVILGSDFLSLVTRRPYFAGYVIALLHRSDAQPTLALGLAFALEVLLWILTAFCLSASPWAEFFRPCDNSSWWCRLRMAVDKPTVWGIVGGVATVYLTKSICGELSGLNDYFQSYVQNDQLFLMFLNLEFAFVASLVAGTLLTSRTQGRSAIYVRVMPPTIPVDVCYPMDFTAAAVQNVHLRLDPETFASVAVLAREKGETDYAIFDHRLGMPIATHEFMLFDFSQLHQFLGLQSRIIRDPRELVSIQYSYTVQARSFDSLLTSDRSRPLPSEAVSLFVGHILRNPEISTKLDQIVLALLHELMDCHAKSAREFRDDLADIHIEAALQGVERLSQPDLLTATSHASDMSVIALQADVLPLVSSLRQEYRRTVVLRDMLRDLNERITDIPLVLPGKFGSSLLQSLFADSDQAIQFGAAMKSLLHCAGIELVVHGASVCPGATEEFTGAMKQMAIEIHQARNDVSRRITEFQSNRAVQLQKDLLELQKAALTQLSNFTMISGHNPSPVMQGLVKTFERILQGTPAILNPSGTSPASTAIESEVADDVTCLTDWNPAADDDTESAAQ